MIYDMQNYSTNGDFFAFPDWPFAALPRTDLREQTVVTGGSTRPGGSVTGSVDGTPLR